MASSPRRPHAGRFCLPTSGLRAAFAAHPPSDVRSANWLRPVGASLQPFGKVHEVALQILPVVPPRLAVDACRCVSLDGEIRRAQRSMSYTWCMSAVNCCFLSFLAACRTRSRALGTLARPASGACCSRADSLGQPPSLHRLRCRLPSIVRDFPGTTELSDFPSSFVIVVRPGASRCGLGAFHPRRQRDLPVPVQVDFVRAWGL